MDHQGCCVSDGPGRYQLKPHLTPLSRGLRKIMSPHSHPPHFYFVTYKKVFIVLHLAQPQRYGSHENYGDNSFGRKEAEK